MRPMDSSYDRMTSETRGENPGKAKYALITDHNGPCSLVAEYDSLSDAIGAARTIDTDDAPTELEDEISYDGSNDRDCDGIIAAAEREGWSVVASAPAGEYWTVMVKKTA